MSLITTTAAAPSFRGQALPAVTVPPSRKTGCSVESLSSVVPARGPSSFVDHGAVGQRDRDDLALEEAVGLVGDGEFLAANGELVHLETRHVLELGDVLRGLAHGDVDVGQSRAGASRARRPAPSAARVRASASAKSGFTALPLSEAPLRETRHGLHARGDEDVALAGTDRVRRHANRLERRRAVAVDRDAGDVVESREHRRDPRDVEAGLAGGLAAARP